MAKGYSIAIASDTKAFATGVQKGIIEPLEDAAEIIEDIGSDSGRDLDKLKRSMEQAQDETDDVKKAFSDLQKEIRETGRKARTDFADPANRASRDVRDELSEVSNEAKQNAAEMFSSFDGSFESIADAAQGTLGGLVGGLGSIPAIASVAAGAAGLGLLTSELTKQIDRAEDLKKSLIAAYAEAAEEGRDFLNTQQIIAEAQDILFNPDRKGELDQFKRDAELIGVDINTYTAAMAGDYDAVTFAIEQARAAEAERRAEFSGPGVSLEQREAIVGPYRSVVETLEGLGEQHVTNRELAGQYADFVATQTQRERDEVARVRDAEAQRWDEAARRYDEAAGRPPIVTPVTLQPDESALDRALARPRTLKLNIEGMTRNGQKVI